MIWLIGIARVKLCWASNFIPNWFCIMNNAPEHDSKVLYKIIGGGVLGKRNIKYRVDTEWDLWHDAHVFYSKNARFCSTIHKNVINCISFGLTTPRLVMLNVNKPIYMVCLTIGHDWNSKMAYTIWWLPTFIFGSSGIFREFLPSKLSRAKLSAWSPTKFGIKINFEPLSLKISNKIATWT